MQKRQQHNGRLFGEAMALKLADLINRTAPEKEQKPPERSPTNHVNTRALNPERTNFRLPTDSKVRSKVASVGSRDVTAPCGMEHVVPRSSSPETFSMVMEEP